MVENSLTEILKNKNLKEVKAEIVTLDNEGDFISGTLVAKDESNKYGDNFCYSIKEESGILKVIFGNPVMNSGMASIKKGDFVAIERTKDKPTDKGNPLKTYKIYSQEKEESKE